MKIALIKFFFHIIYVHIVVFIRLLFLVAINDQSERILLRAGYFSFHSAYTLLSLHIRYLTCKHPKSSIRSL